MHCGTAGGPATSGFTPTGRSSRLRSCRLPSAAITHLVLLLGTGVPLIWQHYQHDDEMPRHCCISEAQLHVLQCWLSLRFDNDIS
jgi:hypothetical protein